MSKHTDGPWHFGKYADRVTATEDSDGRDSICHVYSGNQRANARLIAAAPDLLAACKEALYQLQGMDSACVMILKDAIKKAEGEV